MRYARQHGNTLNEQLQLRALFLARREKLDQAYDFWLKMAKGILLVLFLFAIIAGAGSGAAVLGKGTQAVNLSLALLALLGIHSASFIAWLLGLTLRPSGSGSWLGQFWLWTSKILARQPQVLLAASAAGAVLTRQGSLRWWLSAISHLIWTGVFIGMIATLVSLLSTRFYTFMWETTLLTPDTFVTLSSVIGWLPAQLGFALPPETIIRASSGRFLPDGNAQALWSSWLIGAIVTYGLLPRVLALLACLALIGRAQKVPVLDLYLPGFVTLQPRLQAQLQTGSGIDSPAGIETIGKRQITPASRRKASQPSSRSVIAALELGPHHTWPPSELTGHKIDNAGLIDTLEQRQALLDNLATHPASQLLLVCDANQTPDRGIVHFILDLAHYADHTHIALISTDPAQVPHPAWFSRLQASGIDIAHIHRQLGEGLSRLQNTHDPASPN